MREIIQELIEEHDRLAEVVDKLDAEMGKIAAEGEPNFELLFRVMSFIREYPDVTHHPKEEAVFAAWAQGRPDAQPRVERLIAEHKQIAALTARLEGILKSAVCDGLLGRSWLPLFGVYVTIMRRHMAYENDVVFPEILAALDAPGGAFGADAPALMNRVA